MKLLRIGPVYVLALLCLLVSGGCQLLWMRQLFWAEHARLQRELENQVSVVAEQAIYASARLLPQPVNLRAHQAFFQSPGWRRLRAAFDNLAYPRLGKGSTSTVFSDSLTLGFTLKLGGKYLPRGKVYNSYATTLTPAQLARIDRQSRHYFQRGLDSLLRAQHIGGQAGYRLYRHSKAEVLAVVGASPGRFGYLSQLYAYNDLHLRAYQLAVASLAGAVLYRLRYSLASAGLLLLLTGTTFGVLLKLVRSQRRYAEAQAAFTSNITHELKTPVATVGLALESIIKFDLSQDPAKLQAYVAMGQQELHRLTQLLDKVLALDQAAHGLAARHPELYDVQEGLQQAITALQPQLAAQAGQLTFQPSPEPCLVLGDPVHLANVCYNLLENALKHGGVGVRVQLTCSTDGRRVRLRFQDTGPGIAPAHQAKVFDRFFRAPSPENIHPVKGTGLGLHYVKQIVAQHHGTVTLRSTPGVGSQFTVTLPAA